MSNKLNVLLVAVLGLFAGICVFAEEPEISVTPGDQNSLQIKVKEKAENRAVADAIFGKIGNINTVKLGKDGLYILDSPAPGLNNITLCGAVKVSGQKGVFRIIQYGAGNLITAGYRLSAVANENKFYLVLLVVGFPDATLPAEKQARYSIITAKDKLFTCGEWIFFTAVLNRAGKAEIFVNGELVGGGSIQLLEKDVIAGWPTVISAAEVGDVSLEIANMEVYYSLLSSVDVDKLKDKWLAILKK